MKKTVLFLPAIFLWTPIAQAVDSVETIEVLGEAQSERRANIEEMFFKPYSKDVVGETTILEEGIADVAEAVKDIPGVNVTEQGAFNKSIKIRGLEGARVASLVDGIKISNQGMNHNGAGELGMVEIANIKKIEAIKGSPSVLYDPGASGGVVNVITQTSPLEKGLSFQQKLSYDEGYSKKKSTTMLEGSTGTYGARVTFSNTEAGDYKIKEDTDFITQKHNDLTGSSTSANSTLVSDLGYDTQALSVKLNAKVAGGGLINLDIDRFWGRDMVMIHENTVEQTPDLIHYSKMNRELDSISYRKAKWGYLSDFHIKYAQQYQNQLTGIGGNGVILNSQQLNLISDLVYGDMVFKFGGEVISDDAETKVYSTQNYSAAFVSAELIQDSMTYFTGFRLNHWKNNARFLENENQSVTCQLEGNVHAPCDPPSEKTAPTMAFGAMYSVNEQNNVALNVNTTYRHPDLLELHAFSSNMWGNKDLEPEEGKHAELTWKFLSDELSVSSSVFFSDFKNYIWRKRYRKINMDDGFSQSSAITHVAKCKQMYEDEWISQIEYNKCKGEPYFYVNQYYNSKSVINQGAEVKAEYSIPQHEVIFNSSVNQILSDDNFVASAAQPVDTNISYRYEFTNSWKPWIKLKTQYVMNYPKVEQYGGFDPYWLHSLYAGFKKNGFIINAGVRNLENKTYHAAYSAINGLERTFFINLSYNYSTRENND